MASRFYRDKLQAAMTSANDENVDTSATDWSTNALLLQGVAIGIRASSVTLDSEIEGDTGRAMVAQFKAISDKLELDAADMQKGSDALGIAHTGVFEAIKARNGIMLSGPMNQPPTKPEGPTPGTQATEEQETAMGDYNAAVTQYEANEAAMEENARAALEVMDTKYAEATVIMKEIHGEPDPEVPVTPTPTVPNGPGYATPPPITGTTGQPKDRGGLISTDRGDRDPDVRPPNIPGFVHDPDDGLIVNEDRGLTPYPPPPRVDVHGPLDPTTTHGPTTNVSGSTDGGTSYQGSGSIGAPSAPTSSGASSATAGVGGSVAAGAAGIGLGAGAIKGGGITAGKPPSASGVRGIGAGGRPGAPGSLGKGVTAAGSTSKGSAAGRSSGAPRPGAGARAGSVGANGSAARSSAAKGGARSGSAAGATRSGAAGKGAAGKGAAGKGAAGKGAGAGRAGAAGSTSGKGSSKSTKGKGLFRRGNNGSATGGRSNKKKDDERDAQCDGLVYEQDWLGDDATAPGVLD